MDQALATLRFTSSFLLMSLEQQQYDVPSPWVPDTHMGDPIGNPGSWLPPGIPPAFVDVWG